MNPKRIRNPLTPVRRLMIRRPTVRARPDHADQDPEGPSPVPKRRSLSRIPLKTAHPKSRKAPKPQRSPRMQELPPQKTAQLQLKGIILRRPGSRETKKSPESSPALAPTIWLSFTISWLLFTGIREKISIFPSRTIHAAFLC